jgi:hypothetical protein
MSADPIQLLELVRSDDPQEQNAGFTGLMEATAEPVAWAYDVWPDLLKMLSDASNRRRAIAAQVLCGLARSDPEERMVEDLDSLMRVTRDERFVTARHCLQSLWKVGVSGERQRERLLAALETRFRDCRQEKNHTLIRYDIIEVLRKIHDATDDARVRATALSLIELEDDPKYRKKYSRLWPARP